MGGRSFAVCAILAAAGCADAFSTGALGSLGRLPATASVSLRSAAPLMRKAAPAVAMCAESVASTEETKEVAAPKPPTIPKNEIEMVTQAAESCVVAFKDGVTRQKLRLLMPRDGMLQATDENWPGGIMELYKACAPCVRNLVRKACVKDMAPRIQEQRLDDSGVDGISLFTAECTNARDDVSAFCQPSPETMGPLEQVCNAAGPRLVMMVNPQWRETSDGSLPKTRTPRAPRPRALPPPAAPALTRRARTRSYDELGAKGGLLGQIGNFLGGTAGVRDKTQQLGFKDVFAASPQPHHPPPLHTHLPRQRAPPHPSPLSPNAGLPSAAVCGPRRRLPDPLPLRARRPPRP